MKTEKHDAVILASQDEREVLKEFARALADTPIPEDESLANLGLYLTSKNLSRILFFYEIYQMILHTHGIIVEFGVRWGQTLSIMAALRGIFEPFNRHRKIVGFDTFEGFSGVSRKDGERSGCKEGSHGVSPSYEEHLDRILSMQEALNPIPHLKKYEIVKGDARVTVPAYLKDHPETMVSLAVFDFDIYAPTKSALEAIRPHLFKGSVLVFDELCDDIFPGETVALRETFGLKDLRVRRFPMTSRISYLEVE